MTTSKTPRPKPAPAEETLFRRLRVLVVDDSAVVRQVLTSILSKKGRMDVATAPDPVIAFEKIKKLRPDVIVLDIEMPKMDGLTFLRKLMAEDPIPVVVCSGLTNRGAQTAMRALEDGALAVVTKARLGIRSFLEDSSSSLIETVRDAAGARLLGAKTPMIREPRRDADAVLPPPGEACLSWTTDKVAAVGASAGGTEAIRTLLEAMPPDGPGLVIVQHMPEIFTRAFADRLNEVSRIDVREASRGDRVHPGRALIAPGNQHLLLVRDGGHYCVDLSDAPPVSRHRPSVDVLFRSVARVAGRNAVGVLLTGMGDDGARGLLEMKQSGASTIAQDEATSVVFGMPREAILLGGVDQVLPLTQILPQLLRLSSSA